MSEQEKKSNRIEREVLVEKVREIELAKQEAENSAAQKNPDRDNTAKILNEKRELSEPLEEAEAKRRMSQKSRRTFLIGGATALGAIFGWRSISDETKSALYNRAFRFNENLSQTTFEPTDLAPEFSPELASARANGDIGLAGEFDFANWRLQVVGAANQPGELFLSLDDIKSLPRVEMTTELKCIEGWSVICHWAGARFSDFAARFAPSAATKYVSLVTPDGGYYVGWDMPSILHPQTLLAYEMNGAPLTAIHGAPLRLATATKYGIKQIKRIGRIEFTDERPADYWAERGYDWYSGH